jgi:alpha-tubulin suppressor-like RCC1 family protein
VVAVAANSIHSVALRNDGSVVAWGHFNAYGLDQVPTSATNAVSVAAGGFHNLALKSDGRVIAWGDTSEDATAVPVGLSNVVAIAAGYYHSMALKDDGAVVAWGANGYPYYGQINVPVTVTNAVAIAAGDYHSLAVKSDGTVVAWGRNDSGQSSVPAGLSNVVAIAAGASSSLALTTDGTVVTWGTNPGVPVGLTNVWSIIPVGAVVRDTAPLTRDTLANLSMTSNGFLCTIASESGRVYRLEYVSSLNDTNWHGLLLVPGSGSILTLTDPSATNRLERFYRVRRW